MDIHLDPLGGWSGDMFVAALLDAFPDHWPAVQDAVAGLALGPAAAVRLVAHRDAAGLTGRRFLVAAEAQHDHDIHHQHDGHRHDHHHDGDHRHDDGHHHDEGHHHDHDRPHGGAPHHHRAWSSIRTLITEAPLGDRVKREALAIFGGLAEAEGQVHGVPPGEVTFHEVGAVDSIVDIVAAAQLIALVDARRWSAAPLPLGGGRVRTAHGILPVPAPATALLLRGLATIDDGIAGERVTPTGAAVARHLLGGAGPSVPQPRRLAATGTGLGTRTLPGLSYCLRVLAFEDAAAASAPESAFSHRELGVIAFEVDDLSAEDLSNGLDHIRAMPGIHDVVQSVAFGKKGRMATHVQVLVAPDRLDDAIRLCFAETSTIGLRFHVVQGAALPRGFDTVTVAGRALRTKHVTRPDGSRTAKTEAADVAAEPGHAARLHLRRAAEAQALDRLASDREEKP